MLRFCFCVVAILQLGAASLAGQEPGGPGGRTDLLRRQIEDRFAARVREELGLTDAQSARMRVTVRSFFSRRRDLEAEERTLRSALAFQLRPGVAADQDSVSRLIDSMLELRRQYAQSYGDEMKEMSGYLTPVQRAQYFILRERLLERIREAREEMNDTGNRPRRLRP